MTNFGDNKTPERLRHSHEAKGLVLQSPRSGVIYVPSEMRGRGNWLCVVVGGDHPYYPRGGYDIVVPCEDIESDPIVALVEPTLRGEDKQPDPLDESNHHDRSDRHQEPWVRCVNGKWHPRHHRSACVKYRGGQNCWGPSLSELSDRWGPLTFAPEEDS